jgi:hypothetical protein
MSYQEIPGTIIDAMAGARGEDQQRIAEVGMAWIETILRKNHDYGSSVWKVPLLCPGGTMADAIFVRMTDKVERLISLRAGEPGEVDESLDDTIQDLGAYCLLYLARPKVKDPTGLLDQPSPQPAIDLAQAQASILPPLDPPQWTYP